MEKIEDEQQIENQEYQRIKDLLIDIDEIESEKTKGQSWRQDLKVGDLIDVCLELPKSQRQYVWVQALIISITSFTYLELDFIFDNWQNKKYISKWSIKIAQFQSQTKESYEKQNKLQKKMIIDSIHDDDWSRSTIGEIKVIVEPKINQIIKMAFVEFRVFCRNGYQGWTFQFDEWMPLNSQRIQPFLSQSLYFQKSYKKQENIQDQGLAFTCSAFRTILELNFLTENGKYVDKATQYDESLLFIACYFGRYEVAEYLISKGADLNKKTYYQLSPLIAAVYKGHFDIVRLLVRNGADINLNTKNHYYEEQIWSEHPKDETIQVIYDIQEFERIKHILIQHFKMLNVEQEKLALKDINKNILRKVISEYI
ncbi:ubiquitin carboxyl-terminal hydrolase family protein [Stylonychia lemnae]|uniref:Ubiquitin carboxyl-terminal hydrolase family protein n=1 Tax=Stylonychia lemnae TaxID=5949 RepID=A0A078AXF3_STYLE|nr:ubiquitin carboxyl-terminal hydrolase family protein [Stylonychia lemnae]|eukprot:CDW86849.1 ubiquitin carboxyl-terminal hydrolase family protein [Stylonychia lemnae]